MAFSIGEAYTADAYKSLQRIECQAIYSSAPELRNIVAALKRNETSYPVSSVWNTEEQVQGADKIIRVSEALESMIRDECARRNTSSSKYMRFAAVAVICRKDAA